MLIDEEIEPAQDMDRPEVFLHLAHFEKGHVSLPP
jgi:hypothetical protein